MLARQERQRRRKELTHSRLLEALDYDPETGDFFRLDIALRGGAPIGSYLDNQYKRICIDYQEYLAHRLAWFYVNGEWPSNDIDHINGVRGDNRICNLREATRQENLRNGRGRPSKSGLKGVNFRSGLTRPWYARIYPEKGRKIHLGYFLTAEEAHAAYCEAATKYFGEFARFEK